MLQPETEAGTNHKWETSVKLGGPDRPEWETVTETSVNSAQGIQSGNQVWETSGKQM